MAVSAWFQRLSPWLRRSRQLRRRTRERDYVRLGLARLEDRVVLDAAGVVADVNPGVVGSNPAELTPYNGNVYFSAEGTNAAGQSVGRELYRLDAQGAVQLVADINPGAGSSNPGDFTLFNGRLIFAAEGPQGRELYQVDPSGNVTLFSDVNPGVNGSSPEQLTSFNNRLYFSAQVNNGRELYVANQNGTSSLVADLRQGSASSNPGEFFIYGDNLFFAATNANIRGLYRLRPTTNATPTAINMGSGVTDPRDFTHYDGVVYFSAVDPFDGRELFMLHYGFSDEERVHEIADLSPGAASSSPGSFFAFQDALYFAATGPNGRELYRIVDNHGPDPYNFSNNWWDDHRSLDSNELRQFNIAPGAESSSPGNFASFNNTLYFAATVGGQRGLYRISGNNVVAVTLPAGVSLPSDTVLTSLSSGLYFAANGPNGREVYRLDTQNNVALVADAYLGATSSDPTEFTTFGGKVYFVGTTPDAGRELLVLHSSGSSVRIDHGVLVFRDDLGDKDNRLVVWSDGTRLHIRDDNGHSIALLTSLTGTAGAGTSEIIIPLASLGGVSAFQINTRGGNDSVTFDFSANSNSYFNRFTSTTYDGGSNAAVGDRLRVVGDGTTLNATYTPDALTTGSGVVVVGGVNLSSTFVFKSLEPVDITAMATATLLVPVTATSADELTITSGRDSLNGTVDALIVSGTVGGTVVESAYFFGNTQVVINTTSGTDGNDRVTIASAANAHANRNLRIQTGGPAVGGVDEVVVNGAVTLLGSLTIDTTRLAINAAISTGGTVTLSSRSDIVMSATGRITTSSAAVSLLADSDNAGGGAITMADGAVINAGNSTIQLQAAGNITLGRLLTTNATATALRVTSLAGAILDGGDTGGANVDANTSGAVTTLTAAQGVGTAVKSLDVAAVDLVVVTSHTNQYLQEQDDLQRIDLRAGTGSVSLVAGGAVNDSDAATDVQATSWTVQATSIGTQAARLQTQISSLTATLTSGNLFVTQATGDLRVLQVVASGASAIVDILLQSGNLDLESIVAAGASSLVVLQTPAGTIRDANGNTNNLTANRAELAATQGIGVGNALETALAKLTASGGTGGVFIDNTGNLQIGGTSGLLGLVGVVAQGANIAVTTGQSLTITESVQTTGTGTIFLSAGLDMSIGATVSAVGGTLTLQAARDLSMSASGRLTTTSGAISVLAGSDSAGGGAITMADGAAINAGNATIQLLATGNATLGRLATTNATAGAIRVTSLAGAILDGGDSGGANVDANNVGAVITLTAAQGVGTAAKALDVAAASLVVVTTNSHQYLREQDDLQRLDLRAGAGSVFLVAAGAINDSDGDVDVQGASLTVQATSVGTLAAPLHTQIDSLTATITSGSLYLTQVAGDLRVVQVTAPGANAVVDILVQSGHLDLENITAAGANSLVVLQTPSGAIRDANGNSNNLTANRAELAAAQGIGVGNALETAIAKLTASGGTGGVFIDNTGNLQIGGTSGLLGLVGVAAQGANIAITTSQSLTVGELVQTTGTGTIYLSAGVDLSVAATASAESGTISLQAARDLSMSASGRLTSTSGAISVLADFDNAGGGAITIADGAVINAGSGAIELRATGNVTLGRLVTTNVTPSAIRITSLAGAILDGGDAGGANVDANNAGAVITLTAAQGVGTAAKLLDVAASSLVVVTTNSHQYLREQDDLQRLDLRAGLGNVLLVATGAINDSDADVDVQAAGLTIQATSVGALAAPLQTQIGALTATVTSGSLYLTQVAGDLRVVQVTASAANAVVDILVQSGHLDLENISAAGANSLVVLQTPSGAIRDANGNSSNLTANRAELAAAQGIGVGNALETMLARLNASGGTGGVFIDNTGNLQIGGTSGLLGLVGVAAQGANIAITTSQSLTVGERVLTTGVGVISLSAGLDLLVSAPISTASGSLSLTSGRDLSIAAGGSLSTSLGFVSVVAARAITVDGGATITTASGPITLLANRGPNSTPGNFTGITIGNATISSGSGDVLLSARSGNGAGDAAIALQAASLLQTVSGKIDLVGTGTIVMADGALITSGTGALSLLATGDITLGRLVTANNTSVAIVVSSQNGAILDGGDIGGADVEALADGAVVTLIAQNGVGTAQNSLEIAARQLVVVTGGGDQYLLIQGNLESVDLRAGAGHIELIVGGAITDSDNNVDIQAGSLTVQATSIGTLAAPLQTQIGALSATVTSGSLYLTQVTGDLRVVQVVAPAASAVVDILVQSGNLDLESISALGASSLVVLQTPTGSIRDANGSALNLAASRAELAASDGIGVGNALETALANLTASGGSGGVFITNTGDLQIGNSSGLLGLIGVVAQGGSIGIATSGTLRVSEQVSTSGLGAISLSSGLDMSVNAPVSTASGSLTLLAGRDLSVTTGGSLMTPLGVVSLTADRAILVDGGATITTLSGPITLLANQGLIPTTGSFNGINVGNATISSGTGDILLSARSGNGASDAAIALQSASRIDTTSGSIALIGTGTIVMIDGALISSTTGTLSLVASGNITLGRLVTGNGSSVAIVVSSLSGAILDGGDTGGADVEANANGAVVTLLAASGVGTEQNAIETAARQLVVVTKDSNQYLHELDGLERLDLRAGIGDIYLVAGGVIADGDDTVDIQSVSFTVQALGIGALASPLQTKIDTLTATVTAGDLFLTQVAGDLLVTQITAPGSAAVIKLLVQSGDLNIDGIHAIGASSLMVLQTPGGAVYDHNGALANIVANRVEIAASGGIGVGDALETTITQLVADGGAGGVFLVNTGDLQLGGVAGLLGLVGVLAQNANLDVQTSGTLSVVERVLTTESGTLKLRAGQNLALGATLATGRGAIELIAGGNLIANSSGDVSTAAGAIVLIAGNALTFAGDVALGTGSINIQVFGSGSQFHGIISGSGSFVKTGTGTLAITAASQNTYTGATDILSGVLLVDGAIGAGSPAQRVTIAAGAILMGSGNIVAPIFSSATSSQIISTGNFHLGNGSENGFDFAGVLLIGAGHQVTLHDASLAQLGVQTNIAGTGKLTAVQGVEIGGGEALLGSGAVAGRVVVLAGGMISPGIAAGVLSTDAGDLQLLPGAMVVIQVSGIFPGSQYDQVNVQGLVSLDGAILNLQGGQFRPELGTTFTLLVNDGVDPVSGRFIDASGQVLGEGARIRVGGIETQLSYVGGTGNDVVLTVRDRFVIVATNTTSTPAGAIGGRAQQEIVNFLLRSAAPVVVYVNEPPPPAQDSSLNETNTATPEQRTTERVRVFFRIVNNATTKDEPKEYELDPGVLRDVLGFFKRYRLQDNLYRIYLQVPGKKERLILEVPIVDGRIVPPNFRETENQGAPAPAKVPPATEPTMPPMAQPDGASDKTSFERGPLEVNEQDQAQSFAVLHSEDLQRELAELSVQSLSKVARLLRQARPR